MGWVAIIWFAVVAAIFLPAIVAGYIKYIYFLRNWLQEK